MENPDISFQRRIQNLDLTAKWKCQSITAERYGNELQNI